MTYMITMISNQIRKYLTNHNRFPTNLEVVLSLLLLDPGERLRLRIYAEREARGARGQDTVLYGQLIWWQPF